jgi:glycosyltransferase involved in cell wall biosynthesis
VRFGTAADVTLYSTVWTGRPADFEDGLVVLRRGRMPRRTIARRLWAAEDGDAVLLNGALSFDDRWLDLWLALLVRVRGRRVGIVITDATWHARSAAEWARFPPMHRLVELFQKAMLRAACGPWTHVCFLSRWERQDFARRTGVPLDRVHFTRFFPTMRADETARMVQRRAAGWRPYVFSGGDSLRDYDVLVAALGGTEHEVRVATRHRRNWPANFIAHVVDHERFLELMAGSGVMVVPLRTDTLRSVGQQTYLNAMLLGVPVVVTEALGVRDHVTGGEDVLVVPAGDAAALRTAVDQVLDPAHASDVAARVDRARHAAQALGPETYFSSLKQLLRQAAPLH